MATAVPPSPPRLAAMLLFRLAVLPLARLPLLVQTLLTAPGLIPTPPHLDSPLALSWVPFAVGGVSD